MKRTPGASRSGPCGGGAGDLKAIVGEGDRIRTVLITDLLPESYVWADHQLDAATVGDDVRATIVNTGLLPIRVAAEGGTATSVVSGAVGDVTAPAAEAGHFHDISSTLDLPLWGWVVFFGLCAVPLLWTLIVGLPTEEERRA